MKTLKVFMLVSLGLLFSNHVLTAEDTTKDCHCTKANEKEASLSHSPIDPRHGGESNK